MEKQISMYLMNKKGYSVLLSFIEKFGSAPINCVIIARDKNMEADYYEEIKKLCEKYFIKVFDRKDAPVIESSFSFAIGWRWIIAGTSKLIVFHDSLLPAYRGFAPLVSSLIKNEKKLGVTALFASKEYDKGEIIAQSSFNVQYPIKIAEAIELISGCYISLVNEITEKIIKNVKIESSLQKENESTYSLWRDEEDYLIDWNEDAISIQRFINSTSHPYKGASSFINEKKIRILDSEIVEDVKIEIRQVGKVIFIEDGYPVVVCGKGLIKLLSIKDDSSKLDMLPLQNFRVRFK